MSKKIVMSNALPVRQLILHTHLALGDGNGLMIARRASFEIHQVIAEIHGEDFAAEMAYATGDAIIARRPIDFATLPRGVEVEVEVDPEPAVDPVAAPAPRALHTDWASFWIALGCFAVGLLVGGQG